MHAPRDRGLGGARAARDHAQPEGDVFEHRHVAKQRVVLKYETDLALANADVAGVLAVEQHLAGVRRFQPRDYPQQRGLARARQPQQRDQLAGFDMQVDSVNRDEIAELLADVSELDTHAATLTARSSCCLLHGNHSALQKTLGDQRRDREQGQQRRDRKRGRELVIIVQNLDVQRHRVRVPLDMPRNHRDRAELAHRARVAQHQAVQQPPLDVGDRHPKKHLPSTGAQHDRGFFLLAADRLHDRDQFARGQRKRNEERREHDSRLRKDDPDAVSGKQPAKRRAHPEQQHEQHPRDDRRDRKRYVDQRQQCLLAGKIEARDRPRCGDSEGNVERHRDRGGHQRQPNCGARLGIGDRGKVSADSFPQRLGENRDYRDENKQRDERHRDRDQRRL